jgi:hypothetical protein
MIVADQPSTRHVLLRHLVCIKNFAKYDIIYMIIASFLNSQTMECPKAFNLPLPLVRSSFRNFSYLLMEHVHYNNMLQPLIMMNVL